MAAICGKSVTFTVGGSAYDGHQVTLELSSNEIDVTHFGDGTYGSTLACSAQGRLSASFYDLPSIDIGDSVAWSMTLPYSSPVTMTGNGTVTSKGLSVDAKGVVENTATLRITGAISVS